MAKKNIISDFSALKGKVTFSEKTTDTKMSPKVTPSIVIQKSKTSDDSLKVGQSGGTDGFRPKRQNHRTWQRYAREERSDTAQSEPEYATGAACNLDGTGC